MLTYSEGREGREGGGRREGEGGKEREGGRGRGREEREGGRGRKEREGGRGREGRRGKEGEGRRGKEGGRGGKEGGGGREGGGRREGEGGKEREGGRGKEGEGGRGREGRRGKEGGGGREGEGRRGREGRRGKEGGGGRRGEGVSHHSTHVLDAESCTPHSLTTQSLPALPTTQRSQELEGLTLSELTPRSCARALHRALKLARPANTSKNIMSPLLPPVTTSHPGGVKTHAVTLGREGGREGQACLLYVWLQMLNLYSFLVMDETHLREARSHTRTDSSADPLTRKLASLEKSQARTPPL